MNHSKEEIKEIMVGGLTLLSAMAARKLLEKTWILFTKEDPPTNPEDRGVSWKEAILWTVSTGVILGLTKLVVRRNATHGAEKLLKN